MHIPRREQSTISTRCCRYVQMKLNIGLHTQLTRIWWLNNCIPTSAGVLQQLRIQEPMQSTTSVSSLKILAQFPFFDRARKGIPQWSRNLISCIIKISQYIFVPPPTTGGGGTKFPSHPSIHPLTTISHNPIPPHLKDGFQ